MTKILLSFTSFWETDEWLGTEITVYVQILKK
jgi:hypothetical protein